MIDRQYVHVPDRPHQDKHSWHGIEEVLEDGTYFTTCHRKVGATEDYKPETATDKPRAGHLCGNCSLKIARQTDTDVPVAPI